MPIFTGAYMQTQIHAYGAKSWIKSACHKAALLERFVRKARGKTLKCYVNV